MCKRILAAIVCAMLTLHMSGCDDPASAPAPFVTLPPEPFSSDTTPAPTQAPQSQESETFELLLSHPYSSDSDINTALSLASEQIFIETDGQLKVNVFSSSQLISPDDAVPYLSEGLIDIAVVTCDQLSALDSSFAVLELPYVMDDYLDSESILFSQELSSAMTRLEMSYGITPLSVIYGGSMCLTSSGSPIQSINDIDGLPYYPILSGAQTSLLHEFSKAHMTDSASSSAYSSILTGGSSFAEGTVFDIYSGRLYEVQEYLNLTDHQLILYPLCISSDLIDELPPRLYSTLCSVLVSHVSQLNTSTAEKEQETLSLIESTGMIVSEVHDKSSFYLAASEYASRLELEGSIPQGLYSSLSGLSR